MLILKFQVIKVYTNILVHAIRAIHDNPQLYTLLSNLGVDISIVLTLLYRNCLGNAVITRWPFAKYM